MDLKNLPEDAQHLDNATWQAARTAANSFMNRNWWWVVLATALASFALGLVL